MALGRPVHLVCQCGGTPRERGEVRCGREGPGKALGKGLASTVEDPGEAVAVDAPWLPLVGESGFELGDVAEKTVPGQLAQQVLLTRVTPVQSADADLGSGGDRRDRRRGILEEDRSCGIEDADVVTGRFLPSSAERPFGVTHAAILSVERRASSFCYSGTVHSVPTRKRVA